MKKNYVIGLMVLQGSLGMAFCGAQAAEPMVPLQGHVVKQLQNASMVEAVPDTERVRLSLAITLDPALIKQTVDEIYVRSSPTSRHFLSASEFAQRFSIPDKRQKIKEFAKANGLTVDDSNDQPESMVVNVVGDARTVNKTFHVQMNHYRTTEGRVFRAQTTDPLIPLALSPHLGAVLGLSTVSGLWHPHIRTQGSPIPWANARAWTENESRYSPQFTGTGPRGTLAPTDIQSIYGLNSVTLTGSGQTVGLFELDGYNPADIANYAALFSLPNVPLTFTGVDGTTNLCGGQSCSTQDPTVDTGMQEVALDIEMIMALAHGVSRIIVYDGPNTSQGVFDTYNKIATDNLAKNISTSWGLDEADTGSAFANQESQIFQRMAAQGQTIYAAAGDKGAYDNDGQTILVVDDPASQPYVTGVGGTSLSGTIASPIESVWNNGFDSVQNRFDAGGGGVSIIWPIPPYQQGVPGTASQQFRNVPDVALNADPNSGYAIVAGGLLLQEGGTSAAAPLWAALTALINQQREAAGKSDFGFANPTLYSLALSTSGTVFNDITSGTNGFYSAGPGYDNATGLGSFKGREMIRQASAVSAAPSPATAFGIYAYPNPWDVRKAVQSKITFANLPPNGTVKIFTLSGFWIKTLKEANGQAAWDLTNDGGQAAASGLYLYLVTGDGISKVKGKIAVIR